MMRKRGLFGILLAFLVTSSSGCALTEPLKPVAHYTKRVFQFRGTDYVDPTEEEVDYWITDAGDEARGDQPRERDPDQWWKNYVMSEKARSIERNVGID